VGLRAGASLGASLAGDLNDDPLGALLARHGVESRPATRDDLDFAFAALRDAMREPVEASFGAWSDAEQRALFAPTFDPATHRILRFAGTDAGLLAVESFVDRVHLARIFVIGAARGRGLGTRVLQALAADADARGVPIALSVLRASAAALRLYARLGFVEVAATPTHLHLEREPANEHARN
jgi:GNAT superfamily N-acetyltransferase